MPERTWPVFRDVNELPTAADLSEAIVQALDAAEVLVVLCSPRAARSRYVDAEVRHFKARGGADRVLAVILDGEPNASRKGRPELECFPDALRHAVRPDGTIDRTQPEEPIAADLRDPDGKFELDQAAFEAQAERLGIELKRIAAGIIGVRFGKLVDWEVLAREKRAGQLLAQADAQTRRAEALSPVRDYAKVLESLLKVEGLLESAAALLPRDGQIGDRLHSARRAIFELALGASDLGLASFYLRRVEADEASPAAGENWARLNAAWDRSDPSRSPELRRAFLLALAIPGAAIAVAAIYLAWLENAYMRWIVLLAACAVSVLGSVLAAWVNALRFGKERFLARASLAAYIAFFLALLAGNPFAAGLSAAIVASMSGEKIQRLIWKERRS